GAWAGGWWSSLTRPQPRPGSTSGPPTPLARHPSEIDCAGRVARLVPRVEGEPQRCPLSTAEPRGPVPGGPPARAGIVFFEGAAPPSSYPRPGGRREAIRRGRLRRRALPATERPSSVARRLSRRCRGPGGGYGGQPLTRDPGTSNDGRGVLC